jgi:hypothetical protein
MILNEAFAGAWGFLRTFLFLILILELSLVFEEFFHSKLSLKKGFTGTNSSLFKVFERHLLRCLRIEGSIKRNLAAVLTCVFILMLAGLLPTWGGGISLDQLHSVWIFLGARMLLPVLALIIEWRLNAGRGWPTLLMRAERAIGSATAIFILTLTLVEMAGSDSFSALKNLQNQHSSLIMRFPMAIFIMFGFVVIDLFTSSQSLFAQANTGEKQSGWSLEDFTPLLLRVSWSLFIVDVFWSGSVGNPALDTILLILKCTFVTVFCSLVGRLFIRLRTDQAENFILWRLTPLSILILAVSLLVSGGRL